MMQESFSQKNNTKKKSVVFSEINNKTTFSINKKKVKRLVEDMFKREKHNSLTGVLSVAFVEKKEMRELNSVYRKKDYATDVLSFFYNEGDALGEVVICPEKVYTNSKEGGSSFEREIFRVLIHGVLHILEYRHDSDKEEEEMNKKTEEYLIFADT